MAHAFKPLVRMIQRLSGKTERHATHFDIEILTRDYVIST